eukprot:17375-Eustigmatos_ZCMA.PRE.1
MVSSGQADQGKVTHDDVLRHRFFQGHDNRSSGTSLFWHISTSLSPEPGGGPGAHTVVVHGRDDLLGE